MIAIYRREFKMYIHSFLGWLFMGIVLFFIDLYVSVSNVLYGYPYIAYALQSAIMIFIIAMPILTMRTLAEERKNKIDQLLLTSPVSVGKIITGKYFALETVFAIPCLVVCIWPVVLSKFGTIPYAESYLSILAFFLYGSAAMAIGLFISSLAESQVVAAILSMVAIFVCYIISGLCSMLSANGNVLTRIAKCIDLTTPFINLTNGSLDFRAIVYDISFIGLLLYFSVLSIRKRQYSFSNTQKKLLLVKSVKVIVIIAIVIVGNILLNLTPTKYTVLDVTSSGLYSLTDDSYKTMDTLQEDIRIYVLSTESAMDATVSETLNRYEDYSKHISIIYVDPASNPTFSQKYADSTLTTGSLIVESDKRSKCIQYDDLYIEELNYETYSYEPTGYDAEGQITSALAYVTSDDMPKIYMLTGHGESEYEASYLSAIEKLNIDYEILNLLDVDKVPDDAEALLINAPMSDLSGDDVGKISDYIDLGGNVLFVYGYTENSQERYLSLIEKYIAKVQDGMVLEGDEDHYYQNLLYLFPNIEYDDLTYNITDNYIFVPYASGILIDEKAEEDGKIHYLLTTSESAFGRVDPVEHTELEKVEGDIDGPFALAAYTGKTLEDGTEQKLMVYTSAVLFTSGADEMVSGQNLRLFTNTISSLVDVPASISIPAKNYEISYLTLPTSDIMFISILITIIVPLFFLVTGLFIWLGRRKR